MSSCTPSVAACSPSKTPLPYVAGRAMNLKTPCGKEMQLTITRVLSVTVSPVMEVQLEIPEGSRTAILKLFDRRFGEFRKRHPYSQQAEAIWQDYVRSGLAERLLEELRREEYLLKKARFDEDASDESDEEEEGEEDEDDDDDDAGEQETMIYHTAQKHYKIEVRAYSELKALQGRCIPRFIESVLYNVPDTPADLPVEYFQIPGVLLEYIRGFPLSELTTSIPIRPFTWERVVQSAIDMVRRVNAAGVVHFDCKPRNVVVAELGNATFQPYLIDFAQCGFRADYKDTDDVDDENGFLHIIHLADNHGGIAVLMSQRVKRETAYPLRLDAL